MIKMSPAATDDELAQRDTDYSAECCAILREPTVWSAIERVVAKLMERGKLSAAEALQAIGRQSLNCRNSKMSPQVGA